MSMRNGGRFFPWHSGQSGQARPAFRPATRFPQTSSRKNRATVTLPSMVSSFVSAEQGIRKRPPDDQHQEKDGDQREHPDQLVLVFQVHEEQGDEGYLRRRDQEGHDDVEDPQVEVGDPDGGPGQHEQSAPDRDVDPVSRAVRLLHGSPTRSGRTAETGRSRPGPRNASINRKFPPAYSNAPRISRAPQAAASFPGRASPRGRGGRAIPSS